MQNYNLDLEPGPADGEAGNSPVCERLSRQQLSIQIPNSELLLSCATETSDSSSVPLRVQNQRDALHCMPALQLTRASWQRKTSWLVTEATRQKRLHLVVLICITGRPGKRNLLHPKTEAMAQCDARFPGEGQRGADGDEGGNRGGRRCVAFPRVTEIQELRLLSCCCGQTRS